MFTAGDAKKFQDSRDVNSLDEQIHRAVCQSHGKGCATLRVWSDDWFADTIQHELEIRGFKNVRNVIGTHKWDVYFEW